MLIKLKTGTSQKAQNGEVIDKQFIEAGMKLPFREPEGMAISIPDTGSAEKAYLNIGFASKARSFSSKLINIFQFDSYLGNE